MRFWGWVASKAVSGDFGVRIFIIIDLSSPGGGARAPSIHPSPPKKKKKKSSSLPHMM